MKDFTLDNWKVKEIYGPDNNGKVLLLIRNNIRLYILIFYKDMDKYWHAKWKKIDSNKYQMIKYACPIFKLKLAGYLGYDIYVPNNTKQYLDSIYENWIQSNLLKSDKLCQIEEINPYNLEKYELYLFN